MTKLCKKNVEPQKNDSTPIGKPGRLPLWQALLLPVAAVLIFFLLLEGGLALIGIRPALKSEDPFVGFADNVPLFVPSADDQGRERMQTAPNKLSFFNRQDFPRDKASNTYRIFSLGGSTTYGRPYDDATSFSGWLRELLPAADKSRNWEVINAGGISYASYRVANLMEELVEYQPDLFIIYTGQNEFLEERTYGEIKEIPPFIRSSVSFLAETRTWSAMSGVLEAVGATGPTQPERRERLAEKVSTILDQSTGLDLYKRDDALRENILNHYRISLRRMVDLARSAGAQVIFVAPASSMKDCSPFKSEHTAGLDVVSRKRTVQLLAQAKEAMGNKSWEPALALLEEAADLDPRHAEVHYRRGQTLLALKRYAEAKQALRRARDEDVCPLRALTPMRRIVTEVAKKNGIPFIDYVALLERHMQRNYGHSIPGRELFLDHVHPTIEGHRILATALLETMAGAGLVRLDPDWNEESVAAVAARVEGRIDSKAHGRALANLARVLLWAGKTEDAARLATRARKRAGDDRQTLADSASILTSVYLKNGKFNQAGELLTATLEKAPGAVELHLKLGQILIKRQFRQLEKGAANLLLVCQQMPNYDAAFTDLGLAMARRGSFALAHDSLNRALQLNPKNAKARAILDKLRPMLKPEDREAHSLVIELDVYDSGAPRSLTLMRRDPSGRLVRRGVAVEFHRNARVKRFVDFTGGDLNGLVKRWSRDGELVSSTLSGQTLESLDGLSS